MNATFRLWMRNATRLARSKQLKAATTAIQSALRRGGAWAPGEAATERPVPPRAPGSSQSAQGGGEFTRGSHAHGRLTRPYKLFAPSGPLKATPALVVMLHGCNQDPDDFAAGTGMNTAASDGGFLVLYPAQPADANPQRCWNWFKHNHQQRGRGEPALIHSLVQALVQQRGLDPARVYVAGLSAGGAMASILSSAYPETFAAVGVHSGLARGAARNLPEALAAMRSGAEPDSTGKPSVAVPTIVFHGDSDSTVHPRNGQQVLAAARGASIGAARVEQGTSASGRQYTRSVHEPAPGAAAAEHWLLHGQGHAWSGGRIEGTYTDPSGPDATAEMLRFFFAHPRSLNH